MMIKIFRLFFFCLLGILTSSPSFSQSSSSAATEIEKISIQGRDLILNREYTKALELFKKAEVTYPGSGLGTFGQMALWQMSMLENYDFKQDSVYLQLAAKNTQIVDAILKNPDSSPFELFLAGASTGMKGFYYLRKDQTLKGISEANKAKKALDLALKKDPNFNDALLGTGMYDYWRSVFTQRFSFLPFFKDKRSEGIAKLKKAIQFGKMSPPLAEAGLAFSYYQARNAKEAVVVMEKLLKAYPNNVVMRNLLTDMYSQLGEVQKAHDTIDVVIKKYPEISVAKFMKAKAYLRAGKANEAKKLYEEYLATKPQPAWQSYTLTDLAFIDLGEKKEKEAYEKFKQAYRAYPENLYRSRN